jgi:predicted permease
MSEWDADIRARLSSLRLSPAREAEIVEELSQHLDDRYRDLHAGGLDAATARRAALDELCEPDALAVRLRALRQARVAEPAPPGAPARSIAGDTIRDVRYALRLLRKAPGFAAAAIVTLALGIGANAAIFSLVNATLLQRLPIANGDRLASIYTGAASTALSYPTYRALRDGTTLADGIAAWSAINVSLNAEASTELVAGAIVSGNFFDLLGLRPARGRLIAPSDDAAPGAHPVVVISHDLWQSRFGGRDDVIDRGIVVDGRPTTIVGVLPPRFTGMRFGLIQHVYVPMMMQPIVRPPSGGYSGDQDPDLLTKPNGWLSAIVRARPNVTFVQVRDEIAAIAAAAAPPAPPGAAPVPWALVAVDLGDPRDRGQLQSAAWLLSGVVLMVLSIACANLANLMLSRNAARQREIAVRLSVGASRARLIRQLITESVVLAGIGGIAGLGLAWLAMQALQAWPPPPGVPFAGPVPIDGRVLVFSLLLSVGTGVIFGVAPALSASRPSLVEALKLGTGSRRGRVVEPRTLLVIGQVALSLLLLVAAGLFVRSLQRLQSVDIGLDHEKLVSAPLNVNLLRYTRQQGRQFYEQAVDRVGALPGVVSASVARVAVMTGSARRLPFIAEDGPRPTPESFARGDVSRVNVNVIAPRYFTTLGIPLVAGRDFGELDVENRPAVAIVNQTAAAIHFGAETAIGKRISIGPNGPWREIVGVARDSTYGRIGESPQPAAYLPLAQNHETGMTLYVRASVPPATLAPAIRREIQALDRHLPVPNIQTMDETIGVLLYPMRTGAWLLVAFGGLALTLAAVGVYGVLAFSVARRTREMGIRMALGADAAGVFALVLRDGLRLVSIGIVCGVLAALVAARALAGFLYGVSARDLPTFAIAIAALTAVAFVACAIPARRAVNVDPMMPLRAE